MLTVHLMQFAGLVETLTDGARKKQAGIGRASQMFVYS